MQALTNRVIAVERKPMTFLESMYLWNIFKGMAVTFSHMFKKQPTIQYPEQKRTFSPVFRGFTCIKQG
jgi:NADH-quinone oxidoreductase subunit I